MMRKVTVFLALLFLMPLFGAINVSAESDIGLEEAGITLVAPVSYTHLTLPTKA